MEILKKYYHKSTNPHTGSVAFNSIKPLDLNNFTKEQVKEYFNNSYDIYETLFSSIKYDYAYYLCPDRLRLPLIFYYGHTAAVYVNKLCLCGLIKPNERVNLELETTFETGVDEMSWDDIENYRMGGGYRWPSVEQTKEFRIKVRELINKVIERTPVELPVTWDSPWWGLFMGFEHDRIHLETSSVLIRQYPIDMVQRPACWVYAPVSLATQMAEKDVAMIKVDETPVRLGKSFDFPSYGWDNEYGLVDCRVSAFEASKYKITNEQYMEFVLSGGYGKREYWSDEGWEWVKYKQAKHPLFWVCPAKCKSGCGTLIAHCSHCQERHFDQKEIQAFAEYYRDGRCSSSGAKVAFKFRLMFDVVDMPENWPVEVNYHEAKAYCKWRGTGYRLITEAEHHAIRDAEVLDLNLSSDVIYQPEGKFNHNLIYGSSTPVNMYPSNSKGFHDVFGNVWEWCEDNFNGLPGVKSSYIYDDFSSPCYDGRHNLIMGGSWVSTGDEASVFARYMFRRHFYQHCGFRLARSLPTPDGSKPNPQVRLVQDRIFILGAGFSENKPNLDENELVVSYYPTTNTQYLYDSHLCPEYLDNELLNQFDPKCSFWFNDFAQRINDLVDKYQVKLNLATHLGCSVGRLAFDLASRFDQVIGVDFCGRFLDLAIKLQTFGKLEVKLESQSDRMLAVDVSNNANAKKVIFKQMTWIPNEIPTSDLVVFSMIDRVTNELSWLKRFKETVRSTGLLIIHSEKSKFTGAKLAKSIGDVFDLVLETSVNGNDAFTAWRMKRSYAIENL